ncbi:2-iminobutanoate/2-iminopropanoate deaminase-like isoform X1 [Thalassophryne amazonica]|uniref:2-iminobutanoate/2-iminopropanoate deaminase-like isoform X1 n=1 Tax=Thalassophryne amazonica TaxID=390379 RepID=UPI00147155DA|nr:2-iminobutanoate/2-iminopropanoate deaminase-like isoform X1 [Thalassophryne amazonica]
MAAIIRRIVSTSKAPAAIGPYSQAVVVDRTMYISGQLGMNPADGQLVEGGVQAQTKQALVNMGEILKVAGCGYENVVKTTVLLADMNDFTTVNNIYKQFFSTNFPARAAYQVAALPRMISARLPCCPGSWFLATCTATSLWNSLALCSERDSATYQLSSSSY